MRTTNAEREELRSPQEAEVSNFFKTMAASDKHARCKLPDIAADLMQAALTQLPAAVLDHKVTASNTSDGNVPLRELLAVARAAVTTWHQKMHDDATPTEVASFAHCGSCVRELPDDQSPHEYSRLEVGIHSNGTVIDVMCTRHHERVIRVPLATRSAATPSGGPLWPERSEHTGMAQIIDMMTWSARHRSGYQRDAASGGRWLIEETSPGCPGWRPVKILRENAEDVVDENIVPMEPEDWREALDRFRALAFFTDESERFRLRNVHTGKIIPEGVILKYCPLYPLAPSSQRSGR